MPLSCAFFRSIAFTLTELEISADKRQEMNFESYRDEMPFYTPHYKDKYRCYRGSFTAIFQPAVSYNIYYISVQRGRDAMIYFNNAIEEIFLLFLFP